MEYNKIKKLSSFNFNIEGELEKTKDIITIKRSLYIFTMVN